MDLEVQVVRGRLRVAGVADEADHGAGAHLAPVDGERREGGEVGVVELVALPVAEPEPEPAAVVPADREDGAVGDREERRAERGEDVLAVVPADAGPGRAERVGERRRAVDGEDVAGRRERRRHVGRGRSEDRAGRSELLGSGGFGSGLGFGGGRLSASRLRGLASSWRGTGSGAGATGVDADASA